jgi:rabenosyn-5
MALLPDYEDAPVMKEGFLCPVCLEDFPGINDLQEHFTSGIHDEKPDATEEDSVTQPFKKRVQTIGVTRSHMEDFSNTRMDRVEWYEAEMSKVLKILQKLTTLDTPANEEQKRIMEKQVVSWVADQDVPLCPTCGRSFNFTRRRHHCRVCGAIMCHQCSNFLDHEEVRQLVHGDDSDDSEEETPATTAKSGPLVTHNLSLNFGAAGSLASSLKKSMRRGSTTSLLSVVSAKDSKDLNNIRVCYDCNVLLNRKRNELDEKRSSHALSTFYRKLRDRMEEAEKLVHVYYKICYSFSMGETVYDLEEAQALRVKLIRLSEEIDILR